MLGKTFEISEEFIIFAPIYRIALMSKGRQRLINMAGEYLQSVLGVMFRTEDSSTQSVRLPYYLSAGSKLEGCTIDGHKCLLVMPDELADGSTLSKRVSEITQRTGVTVVLLVENIDAVRRRALIANRTDFIVPGKQAYLPSLGAVFTERGLAQAQTSAKQALSPAAQVLLLFHLQIASLEGRIISEIAREFPYSIKTISAAVKEMEQCDVCTTQGDNSGKFLHFLPKGEIWEKTRSLLTSPIQDVVFCDTVESIPEQIRFVTYDKALAEYTFMADFGKKTYAVYKNDDTIKRLKKDGAFNAVEGAYRIELWKYDPALMAKGNMVDALSLALCYKDSDDERVAGELSEMVKRICRD